LFSLKNLILIKDYSGKTTKQFCLQVPFYISVEWSSLCGRYLYDKCCWLYVGISFINGNQTCLGCLSNIITQTDVNKWLIKYMVDCYQMSHLFVFLGLVISVCTDSAHNLFILLTALQSISLIWIMVIQLATPHASPSKVFLTLS
jgi:hypothetical protein